MLENIKTMKLQRKHINIITYTIICLMISISIASILGSVAMTIISDDYYQTIFGMKAKFKERDDINKTVVDSDELTELLNFKNTIIIKKNEIEEESSVGENQIRHLFKFSSDSEDRGANKSLVNNEKNAKRIDTAATTTEFPPTSYDDDFKFLTTMQVDITRSRWSVDDSIKFLHMFPIISEIVAIIWAVMATVYQSNPKYYSGLPKPWRIVVPSIIVFFVMIILTIIYIVIVHIYLNEFCNGIKSDLHHKTDISCGLVMSALRPITVAHKFTFNTYLKIFTITTYLVLSFWLLAFLIMLVRFICALDFKLVEGVIVADYKVIPTIEISPSTESAISEKSAKELTEDDDFYSVESHLNATADSVV